MVNVNVDATTNEIVCYGYAVTVALFGIIGYLRSGSFPSLVFGVGLGVLLLVGSYQYLNGEKAVLLLGSTFFMTFLMGLRYSSSDGEFFPAGFLTLLSLLMMVKVILAMIGLTDR